MGKEVIKGSTSFFGGLSDDPSGKNLSQFKASGNFDVFSLPNRLTPYRSLEADENDGSTSDGMKQYFLRDFRYASGSAKIYAMGQNGSGYPKIVYKNDATTGNWILPSSSEGNGAVRNGCFFEYKDYMWFFQGNTAVAKWGLLSGTPTITNLVANVASTITSVADGIIAADGNGYMAYNNVVVRISTSGTVTDLAKTVPDNFKITSLSNYGRYMAIACAPKLPYNGESKVFIWDLSSDLFTDTIPWGEGDLQVLESVEGAIVGVTDRYLNNSAGAGKGALVVKVYQNGTPQVVKEIFTKSLVNKSMPQSKAVKNGRLFFSAKIMTNAAGTEYVEGIFSFGRKTSQYPSALALDIVPEGVNTSGIQAFGTAGNFFFVAHSNDGSIEKTNDSAVYAHTSFYETQDLDFDDPFSDKTLLSVKVSFSKITSGQSVTAKCKWDDAMSFTTIGTFSTVGKTSRTFVNIESTGLALPSGKELSLRFETTGGLEITGWSAKARINDNP